MAQSAEANESTCLRKKSCLHNKHQQFVKRKKLNT